MPVSIRQIDNADKLPPERATQGRSAPWSRGAIDPGVVLFGGAFVLLVCLLVVPLFAWMFGAAIRDWLTYGDGAWLSRVVIGLGLLWLVGKVARSWMFVRVDGRMLPTRSMMRIDAQTVISGEQAIHATYAGAVVPAQITYSPTIQAPKELTAGPAVTDVTPRGPALIPDVDWRAWIDRTPHLMIAGRTEAGKTTLAEAIIAERAIRGELLLVLDPHYQPGKWCGLPAIGGGRGYGDVLDALGGVMAELDSRYEEFNRGRRTDEFDRLTVFVDEVPALVEWCFDGKALRDRRWMSFAKQLGSEARKVRLSVILMTQSPLVQDIMINSRMRENFNRIALGDQAGELLTEERDPKRRAALTDLLRGRQYTAAMEFRNEVHVLDTTNVPMLAQRPITPARTWSPAPAIPAGQPSIAVAAARQPDATARASISLNSLLSQPVQQVVAPETKVRTYLKAMVGAGKSRDYARQRMTTLGMQFENALWTEVRKELGLE